MANMMYRGAAHRRAENDGAIRAADADLIYRGIHHRRAVGERSADVAPGDLQYRGVSHLSGAIAFGLFPRRMAARTLAAMT